MLEAEEETTLEEDAARPCDYPRLASQFSWSPLGDERCRQDASLSAESGVDVCVFQVYFEGDIVASIPTHRWLSIHWSRGGSEDLRGVCFYLVFQKTNILPFMIAELLSATFPTSTLILSSPKATQWLSAFPLVRPTLLEYHACNVGFMVTSSCQKLSSASSRQGGTARHQIMSFRLKRAYSPASF
jgi:hypothetical protein